MTLEALQRAARGDTRPTLPEPPPVRLQSVADVTLEAAAGLEAALDDFYVGLLKFAKADDAASPTYEAERFAIKFKVSPTPVERDDRRPLGVTTPFYREFIEALEGRSIEYERVRGLVAGEDGVLLRDPAGNRLAVGPWAEVR